MILYCIKYEFAFNLNVPDGQAIINDLDVTATSDIMVEPDEWLGTKALLEGFAAEAYQKELLYSHHPGGRI